MTITTESKFLATLQGITGKTATEIEAEARRAAVITSFRYGMAELLQQILSSSLSDNAQQQAVHSALGMLAEPARSSHRDALIAGAQQLGGEWGQPAADEPLMVALDAALDAVESALRDAFGGAR